MLKDDLEGSGPHVSMGLWVFLERRNPRIV